MDFKKRLKQEAGYLKKGTGVLARKATLKIKESGKAYIAGVQVRQKELATLKREIKEVERASYRKTLMEEAEKRGAARAKQAAAQEPMNVYEFLMGKPEKKKE